VLATNILKYDKNLLESTTNKDHKSSISNKITADEKHLKVLEIGYEFVKSCKQARENRVRGRIDMQKIYLSKALYNYADMQFETFKTAAVLAVDIVDMSAWQKKNDLNKAGTIVATD